MLVLLRLAEDVITFQTLPTQRRRDIQQTLTQNMDSIFTFLLGILQLHVNEYNKLVSSRIHDHMQNIFKWFVCFFYSLVHATKYCLIHMIWMDLFMLFSRNVLLVWNWRWVGLFSFIYQVFVRGVSAVLIRGQISKVHLKYSVKDKDNPGFRLTKA